jgi:hypothetical protein
MNEGPINAREGLLRPLGATRDGKSVNCALLFDEANRRS